MAPDKLREGKPDVPVKTAVRWVCKTAVSRVWNRTRFVSTRPHPGYRDAMDGATREEFPETFAQRESVPYRDPTDRTNVELLIATLPKDLQPVARLLSYGMSRGLVAERRGITPAELRVLIGRLRELLAETDETETVEPESDERVRFMAPSLSPAYAKLLVALRVALEHNPLAIDRPLVRTIYAPVD